MVSLNASNTNQEKCPAAPAKVGCRSAKSAAAVLILYEMPALFATPSWPGIGPPPVFHADGVGAAAIGFIGPKSALHENDDWPFGRDLYLVSITSAAAGRQREHGVCGN